MVDFLLGELLGCLGADVLRESQELLHGDGLVVGEIAERRQGHVLQRGLDTAVQDIDHRLSKQLQLVHCLVDVSDV